MICLTLPPLLHKWVRYVVWGILTFGSAFGLPMLTEGLFATELPELLWVLLMIFGFFCGGIGGGILTERLIRPRCPQCRTTMYPTWNDGERGQLETYHCPSCGFHYEVRYPKMGVGN